jgi:hypothetical protein
MKILSKKEQTGSKMNLTIPLKMEIKGELLQGEEDI